MINEKVMDIKETVEWRGIWIGENWARDANPLDSSPVAFRKDICLKSDCQSAFFKISSFAQYTMWINGNIVSYGPARSFPKYMEYDCLDLTGFFNKGVNSIAVVVKPGTGVNGYCPVSRLGLFIQAQIKCDGMEPELITDETWKVRTAYWYNMGHLMTSMATGFQEHFNGLDEPKDWKISAPNEGWSQALYLGPVGTPPWKTMQPRSIPMLEEKNFNPKNIWNGKGNREIIDENLNLAVIFNNEPLQGNKNDRNEYSFYSTNVYNIFVFDFKKTRYIRPAIEISDATGSLKVEFYYSIDFNDRPNSMLGFGNPYEGFVDTYTPINGDSYWEGLSPRGFRFLTIKITGDGNCKFQPKCKTVDYPYQSNAKFSCEDELIQKIWDVSADTIRSATNDVIVDTCSRENVLWTLDACLTAKAAFYTFGELDMWRRCLLLIAQGIDENGIPKTVVPAEDSFMKLFDQNLYWVVSCYDYYMASGDKSFIKLVAEPILRFISLCNNHITSENLFVPPAYSWHWIDWAYIDKRPYSLPINCLLIMAADVAKIFGAEINCTELYDISKTISERVRIATSKFYDEAVGCFKTHIEPEIEISAFNKFGFENYSNEYIMNGIHANSLACCSKCGSAAQRKSAMAFVAKQLEKPQCPNNLFGPGWTFLILSPLFDYGYGKQAKDFAKRIYGNFIEVGTPTWGEDFKINKYNSAHGWGSCVNTLIIENMVGITPIKPGWKQILRNKNNILECFFSYELKTPY